MLWTVVRVQWTILRRDRTVWLLLALFVGLLVYTGAGGLMETQERAAHLAEVQRAETERLQALEAELTRNPPPPPKVITTKPWTGKKEDAPTEPDKTAQNTTPPSKEADPYKFGHELRYRTVALPLGPLAALTQGGGDARPSVFAVTLDSELTDPEQAARPISLGRMSLGLLDMAFVLLYLLPLLIIALMYDLLLGERELQTLALVLSQPVSPATFILGKMLARAALIVLATLVPTVVFWWLASPASAAEMAVATGLGALLLLGYAAFWMAAAMATNAWMRSSASSALALMGLWLACLVLVPGLIRISVEALYPPPLGLGVARRRGRRRPPAAATAAARSWW